MPALTLPYFIVKGQWKLVGLVLVMTAALVVAPSMYFGLSGNRTLVEDWYQHVVGRSSMRRTARSISR